MVAEGSDNIRTYEAGHEDERYFTLEVQCANCGVWSGHYDEWTGRFDSCSCPTHLQPALRTDGYPWVQAKDAKLLEMKLRVLKSASPIPAR